MKMKVVGLLSGEDDYEELALTAKIVLYEQRMKQYIPSVSLHVPGEKNIKKHQFHHSNTTHPSTAVFTVHGLT